MSDPAIVIAVCAVVIACLSAFMAWNTLSYAKVIQRQHDRLYKEFWKQSHEQAAENGKQWGYQLRQAEWLRDQFPVPRRLLRNKPPQQPN